MLRVSSGFGADCVGRSGTRAFRIGRNGGVAYHQLADQSRDMVVRAQGFLSPHCAQLSETSGTEPRGRLGGSHRDLAEASTTGAHAEFINWTDVYGAHVGGCAHV